MVSNTLMMAAALATSLTITLKALQDPAMDYRFAAPVLQAVSSTPTPAAQEPRSVQITTTETTSGQDPVRTETITSKPLSDVKDLFYVAGELQNPWSAQEMTKTSVSFHSAHFADVLKWLDSNNVSYIVPDESMKGQALSMHLVNVPLHEAVDAIASALGGHWRHQGSIRIFALGGSDFATFSNNDMLRSNARVFDLGGVDKIRWMAPTATPAAPIHQELTKAPENPFALMKSLSDSQKELQKSRGYLYFSDLTTAQRKMIGIEEVPGTGVTLTFDIDNQSITIKSK